ncbi:uncharacterized [Tachysurus ichikawai]
MRQEGSLSYGLVLYETELKNLNKLKSLYIIVQFTQNRKVRNLDRCLKTPRANCYSVGLYSSGAAAKEVKTARSTCHCGSEEMSEIRERGTWRLKEVMDNEKEGPGDEGNVYDEKCREESFQFQTKHCCSSEVQDSKETQH